MLNPASANWLKVTFLDLLLDTIERRRIVLFQPFVLLSLRADEAQLGIALDEIALTRPRPIDLTLCFIERPQPASVNVAVSNTSHNSIFIAVVNFV